ncbi:MAG: CoA transferase [Deltaproteobacteria bacterium]|nr:CoA transferase [Deltaproteobacteria bacterium]MBW2394872.1 CoA transferase [Deltaproteobacteria bacterium]
MKPLCGMRVVDLADEKGELCGRLLADLGAEVIRLEPPEGGASRRLPPFTPDGQTSLYFAVRNAGKRGGIVDLETEAGRERLHDLLANADLLIESTQPGSLARIGLDADALRKRHPGLIVTSITDFGQDGPYAAYQGTNMVGVAMAGMLHRAGIAEKPPVMIPGSLAYDVAGIAGALGSLMALWKRMQSGVGQHIDVSAMDATAGLSDWSLPNYSLNPNLGHRAGTGIYTLYRCADGFIRMIILVPRHWRALKSWIGNPEELEDPKYDQFINRLVDLDKIVPVLEGFFADKKKTEIAVEAQRRGIPATPLLRPGEVLENEHTTARRTFRKLSVAPGILASVASGYFTIDGERAGPETGPPELGELGEGGWTESTARQEIEALLGRRPRPSVSGRPLEGLRVIDCGVGAVGVEVGRLLAEYGADVIKIESSDTPDFIRVIMSSYMNPSFLSSSRSKRSFGVDLRTEKGRALVAQLVQKADVFIENNGTGTMEKLGLGAEQLHELNPRIVSFSSQSVGSYGPWKNWIGYGPNTHPVSGLQHLWNYLEDEERPAGSTAVHPDHLVGRLGALAALAGLIFRERSGRGSHHDAAQFETPIGLMADLFALESLAPGSVRPAGNASSRGAPWSCLACAGDDEWCVINVRSDSEWQQLRKAIGDPPWSQDPALDSAEGRIDRRDHIDEQLSVWTGEREPREVMETLQEAGVPAGIVAHPVHHLSDPQLLHRGYPKLLVQPDYEAVMLEGPSFLGSDLPEVITEPAPWLGQHTREIASELLGLSEAEIEALIEEKVIEDPPKEFKIL